MVLVHASPTTLAFYRTPNLGVLCSPRRVYGDELAGWTWAADNDAFNAWDEDRYRKMLDRIAHRPGCLFVTSPDVVGDAATTLEQFHAWRKDLEDVGQPIALVGQDGLENPPWDSFQAFFVGGSTEWKMGVQAAALIVEAKKRGKWVHMGRVNSHRRIRYAKAIGCDSIDGTQFSWFRDTKLPDALVQARLERQLLMEEA